MKAGDLVTHMTLPHLGKGIIIHIYDVFDSPELEGERPCRVLFGMEIFPTSENYLEIISESR